MRFEERLLAHKELFKANIQGMGFSRLLDAPSEQIIDYYGVEYLVKKIHSFEKPAEFISFAFLDALFHSASHCNSFAFIPLIKRDILVLNSVSWSERIGNLTHRKPQILLGLKKNWTKKDLELFEKTFQDYVSFYSDKLPVAVMSTIKNDPDLDCSKLDFPCFGFAIDKKIMDSFQKMRKEL